MLPRPTGGEEVIAPSPDTLDPPPPRRSNPSKASVLRPCAHCGIATPCHPNSAPSNVFCCNGCQGAFELIHGWGLDSYYDLREPAVPSIPASGNDSSSFAEFDDDDFLGPSKPRTLSDGNSQTRLAVVGLHCAACAWLIENIAARTPGWQSARVKMSDHSINILFDPAVIRLSKIARLLHQLGYELMPLVRDDDHVFQKQNRKLLVQIAIAAFCASNAMWIAVGLYAGEASGVAWSHREFLRFIGTGLGLVSVFVPGRTFLFGALASLRSRTPHMDLPVALGLFVGSLAGIISLMLGLDHVYFDSLAALVFLLLIGRWIQFHQQHRAAKSVDLLLRVTPRHAKRVDSDGSLVTVLADRLQVGDVIRVPAGDSAAADGTVIRGNSKLNRSLLTGESRSIPIGIGDSVEAGVVNLQSDIDLRITAVGRDSRIGQVMQSVEDASAEKIPIVMLADRIGGVFVITISVLAIVSFVGWACVDWQVAASSATALLIVACPCALALATPLAIAIALGKSAKHQIFIRDGSTLGELAKPGIVWFDKTGTLTEGRPVARLIHGDENAIALASAIEGQCRHPIAIAICQAASRLDLPVLSTDNPIEVGIGGVTGRCENQSIAVGNVDFMVAQGYFLESIFDQASRRCVEQGMSPILIAVDRRVVALLAIEDSIRDGAVTAIADLKERGWNVGILSGDHQEIVNRVADDIGIPRDQCFGGLSPEDKLRRIKSSRSDRALSSATAGTTVMIGDGANDAAALAAADIGIAVRGGAEVSLRAAPVFIASGQLATLPLLFDAAKQTSRLIYTAFAVSLTYNLIAVVLAISGIINPLLAAILMPISSVSVLSLCLIWPIYGAKKSNRYNCDLVVGSRVACPTGGNV
jgi:P-type Cu2+ transporter